MSPSSSRSTILRRFWKPVLAGGASGTAVAVWFEELLLIGAEILALIFLPILAGLIYLLDTFLFKSALPRREDSQDTKKGAEK